MICQKDSDGNVSYRYEAGDLAGQNVLEYWTPERKKAAIPIDGCPAHERPGILGDGENTTDPQPADTGAMPFQAGGILFFTQGNVDYAASAQLLCRGNLLLTAAHCVQDNNSGVLSENFLFERCYDSGKSVERFTFRLVALKVYWHAEKKAKWDYALAVLNEISALTTPLSYSTEDIGGKDICAFGYPGNYYNGERMVFIEGAAGKPSDGTVVISGDKMRNGCSGGAWVLKGTSTVVGVNSYGPVSEKEAYVGSPVLDAGFESLYQYALTLMEKDGKENG